MLLLSEYTTGVSYAAVIPCLSGPLLLLVLLFVDKISLKLESFAKHFRCLLFAFFFFLVGGGGEWLVIGH